MDFLALFSGVGRRSRSSWKTPAVMPRGSQIRPGKAQRRRVLTEEHSEDLQRRQVFHESHDFFRKGLDAATQGLQEEGASAEQDVMDQEQERPTDGDEDLQSTKELLDRTVRFLAQCMEDPTAAMASEDPRALIQGLRSLAVEPGLAETKEKEPRTIQIRHRRSA